MVNSRFEKQNKMNLKRRIANGQKCTVISQRPTSKIIAIQVSPGRGKALMAFKPIQNIFLCIHSYQLSIIQTSAKKKLIQVHCRLEIVVVLEGVVEPSGNTTQVVFFTIHNTSF